MVILFNIVAMIGSILSTLHHTHTLCIGRLIFGFASGVLATATPKILEETIPDKVIDNGYGISTNAAIIFAVLICFLFGLGMPTDPLEL